MLFSSLNAKPAHRVLQILAKRLHTLRARRCLHDSSQQPKAISNVAVLGGGITGLSTAYYLSRFLPKSCRIALFEAGSRFGGWLNSSSVDVGNGKVVFENGPRTLRPAGASGLVTLDLIGELGLKDSIITTSKTSPSAQNRFVYYPDHLVRMPGPGLSLLKSIKTLWEEPIFDGAIRNALAEVTKPRRSADVADESIGSFISRRFSSTLADNVVSAVFHGIYAGDIYKLSARMILPTLWHMEAKHSSIMRGFMDQAFGGLRPMNVQDLAILNNREQAIPHATNMPEDIRKCSVFTFRTGLGKLADGLAKSLGQQTNVSMHRNTTVDNFEVQTQETGTSVQLRSRSTIDGGENAQQHFSHIISTLPSSVLAGCLTDTQLSAKLKTGTSVTVMVVNLFYTNPAIVPVQGFGYLMPRSLPLEENPELGLGVIFDTDATPGQDVTPGTKVTVMLGGHWWTDWDRFPDEEQGSLMAKALLKRHLGIGDEPRAIRVSLQKNCIPQYHVGHNDRMAKIDADLRRIYKGRLRVAGNSYTGVGVNDCVRAARNIVQGLVRHTEEKTGLESFSASKDWDWISPSMLKSE